MGNESIWSVIFWIVEFIKDGILWCYGTELILKGLYGYPIKKNKYKTVIYTVIILLNSIFADIFGIGEIIDDLLLVYWMFHLKENKKLKRLAVSYISLVLVFNICFLFISIFAMIDFHINNLKGTFYPYLAFMGLTLLPHAVTFLCIAFFSKLSSRYRREPMRFSLILLSFIFSIFLESVLYFLDIGEEGQLKLMVTLRSFVPEEYLDRAMAVEVLVFIVAISFLFFFMIIRESEAKYFHDKNMISEYYLEAQKDHYESLLESNREIRKIKHDMKNHIYCLQELSHNGKYEELDKYLKDINDSIVAISNIQVGNEIADAIISEKKKKAEEKKIILKVDGTIGGLNLKAIDTCTIFANLLDNAIEAVCQLPEEYRQIELSLKKNKNYYLITECNRIDHKLDVVDNEILSTKKDKRNHGFGIANMKDAVAKYDGECSIDVMEEEDEYYTFRLDIMIPADFTRCVYHKKST